MSNTEVKDNIIMNSKQEAEGYFKRIDNLPHKCLKFSIEFKSFVDLIFNKINNYLEDNDILKYKEFVSNYETLLNGK